MSEQSQSAADILQRALELLGPNGENWTKGYFAYDEYGMETMGYCDVAKCWCAAGAIQRVINESDYDATYMGVLSRAIFGNDWKPFTGTCIGDWNDAPERTWPEVKAAFERAIALASEGKNV